MGDSVTICVWKDCTVCVVFNVSPTGHLSIGAVGGASYFTHIDIEIDPWANLVVDNRAEYPTPVSIRNES